MQLRIVKVGGSLCNWPELPRRLDAWLARPAPPTLLVAGGGAAADLVRAADRRWNLPADDAHDLALAAMHACGRLLAALLPERLSRQPLTSLDACRAWAEAARADAAPPPLAWIDPAATLDAAEAAAGRRLVERSWRVTSDSLAAWFASRLQAEANADVELVLLKSTSAEPSPSMHDTKKALADWARTGLVDECFVEYAADLRRVRCVDLRAADEPASS